MIGFLWWHINLCGLLNAKPISVEEQQKYFSNHIPMYKEVHTFPMDIRPKGNVKAWLELELAYFKAAVQHFSHYATETPCIFGGIGQWQKPFHIHSKPRRNDKCPFPSGHAYDKTYGGVIDLLLANEIQFF